MSVLAWRGKLVGMLRRTPATIAALATPSAVLANLLPARRVKQDRRRGADARIREVPMNARKVRGRAGERLRVAQRGAGRHSPHCVQFRRAFGHSHATRHDVDERNRLGVRRRQSRSRDGPRASHGRARPDGASGPARPGPARQRDRYRCRDPSLSPRGRARSAVLFEHRPPRRRRRRMRSACSVHAGLRSRADQGAAAAAASRPPRLVSSASRRGG